MTGLPPGDNLEPALSPDLVHSPDVHSAPPGPPACGPRYVPFYPPSVPPALGVCPNVKTKLTCPRSFWEWGLCFLWEPLGKGWVENNLLSSRRTGHAEASLGGLPRPPSQRPLCRDQSGYLKGEGGQKSMFLRKWN